MIKYFIKEKMKKEAKENSKKIMIYTGVALVGAFATYKLVKRVNKNKEEALRYLEAYENDDYDDYNVDEYSEYYCECDDDCECEDELKQKVDEFNSNRISCENCASVSPEELAHYVEKAEDTKKDVEVNNKDFKAEDYDNYEYNDGHVIENDDK